MNHIGIRDLNATINTHNNRDFIGDDLLAVLGKPHPDAQTINVDMALGKNIAINSHTIEISGPSDFRPFLRGDTLKIIIRQYSPVNKEWRLGLYDGNDVFVKSWDWQSNPIKNGKAEIVWDGKEFEFTPSNYIGKFTLVLSIPDPAKPTGRVVGRVQWKAEPYALYQRKNMTIIEVDSRYTDLRLLHPTLMPEPENKITSPGVPQKELEGYLNRQFIEINGKQIVAGLAAFNTVFFTESAGLGSPVAEISGDIVSNGKLIYDTTLDKRRNLSLTNINRRALFGIRASDKMPTIATNAYSYLAGSQYTQNYSPSNYSLALTGLGIVSKIGILGADPNLSDNDYLKATDFYGSTPRVVFGINKKKQSLMFAYAYDDARNMIDKLQTDNADFKCEATAYFDSGGSITVLARGKDGSSDLDYIKRSEVRNNIPAYLVIVAKK